MSKRTVFPCNYTTTEPPKKVVSLWYEWCKLYDAHDTQWVPLGMLGCTLMLGHYAPDGEAMGFPIEAHQCTLIPRGRYDQIKEKIGELLLELPALEWVVPKKPRVESWLVSRDEATKVLLEDYILDEAQKKALEKRIQNGDNTPEWILRESLAFLLGTPICDVSNIGGLSEPTIPAQLTKDGAVVVGADEHEVYFTLPKLPNMSFMSTMSNILESSGRAPSLILTSLESQGQQRIAANASSKRDFIVGPKRFVGSVETDNSTDIILNEAEVLSINPGHSQATPDRLWRYVLMMGINLRASDIDLMLVSEQEGKVRYRIDGSYREALFLDAGRHGDMVRAFKSAAGLGPEYNKCQDGKMAITVIGKNNTKRGYNLRVSAVPHLSSKVQTMSIRVLKRDGGQANLRAIGLSAYELGMIEDLISTKRGGLILVLGPTGSGKTTTLYACVDALNKPSIKISTAEDPVEYTVEGISQVPVDRRNNVTFAEILRALLRQAPNVILVGEMRDHESADVATEAAMTGHLVLSTMHTESVAETPLRLIEGLKVERTVAASVMVGLIAQRLIRRACRDCRTFSEPTLEERVTFEVLRLPVPARMVRTSGCPNCGDSGYYERFVVMEFLPVKKHVELSKLVLEGADEHKLREAARELGYQTMLYSAMAKVAEGVTTFDEAMGTASASERHILSVAYRKARTEAQESKRNAGSNPNT